MRRIVFALSLSVLTSAVFASPAEILAAPGNPTKDAADVAGVPEAKAVAEVKRNCIRDTGTRIARRDKDGCNGLPGRSYSQNDIRRTGEVNVADALQRLDPSISLHR